jgi:hypothetical protein
VVIVAVATAISEREERSSNAGCLQPCASRCRCVCAPIICIELLHSKPANMRRTLTFAAAAAAAVSAVGLGPSVPPHPIWRAPRPRDPARLWRPGGLTLWRGQEPENAPQARLSQPLGSLDRLETSIRPDKPLLARGSGVTHRGSGMGFRVLGRKWLMLTAVCVAACVGCEGKQSIRFNARVSDSKMSPRSCRCRSASSAPANGRRRR